MRYTQASEIKKTVSWYNDIANLFWSALSLIPITVFCYKHVDRQLCYAFLAVSLFTLFLPISFFHRIRLGKNASVYDKAGVLFINKFIQNGQIINGLLRKRYPQYRIVSSSKRSVNSIFQQTYMYKKFHFMLFTFFSLVFIYALAKDYIGWALLLLLTNILFNVYPCLLQQYIRVRLASSVKSGGK